MMAEVFEMLPLSEPVQLGAIPQGPQLSAGSERGIDMRGM